ncbi:MAG: alpha/beta fold hydrolase [Planctomycetia bacterium]|nr:alpha/beta fold hydrolase [Planctomycetia bacterium]
MSTKKHVLSSLKDKNTLRPPVDPDSLPESELWRPLYPFESRYTRLGGFTCHYIDEYESALLYHSKERGKPVGPEELPTLLFVHGNPTWSFYWRNLMTAYRDHYRVVAFDHIGCGLSEKPQEVDYPYTLARRINDLNALIQKLNLHHVTLVAHDWGGAIGLGSAARSPKRFERFALLNTGAFRFATCPLRIRICRAPILGRLLIKGLNVFPQAAVRMATSQKGGLDKAVASGLLAPYASWHDRVAVYEFVQDIPLSEKHRSWARLIEVEQGLEQFRTKPVALIWGMQDWCFTGEYIKKFLQYYPEAQVSRIESAGHYVVEDALDEVKGALDQLLKKQRP